MPTILALEKQKQEAQFKAFFDYTASSGSRSTSSGLIPKHQEVKITTKTKLLFAVSYKEALNKFWFEIIRTEISHNF